MDSGSFENPLSSLEAGSTKSPPEFLGFSIGRDLCGPEIQDIPEGSFPFFSEDRPDAQTDADPANIFLLQKELKGVVGTIKANHAIAVGNRPFLSRERINEGKGYLGVRGKGTGGREIYELLHLFKAPSTDNPGRNQNELTRPAARRQEFLVL